VKHIKTVLILCLVSLMLFGCASNSAPEANAQTEAPEANTQTEAPEAADPSPSAVATEPEPTGTPLPPESDEEILPVSEFNAEKKTLYVTGSGSFDQTLVPEEIKDAKFLDVQSELFRLSVYLPILNVSADTLPAYVPSYIDRTDKSFRFIRSYLMENAPDLYPKEIAEKPIELRIRVDGEMRFEIKADHVLLRLNTKHWIRDEMYILALMNPSYIGWKHLGYAYCFGCCIDPYSELPQTLKITEKSPYYELCKNAGVDFEHLTEKDFRTIFDASSRICIDRGLSKWGSIDESEPLSTNAVYNAVGSYHPSETREQDELFTVFSASSFIARLTELYGFEAVTAFCFGQKTFEEAFGTDFDTAFNEWKNRLIETYPMN